MTMTKTNDTTIYTNIPTAIDKTKTKTFENEKNNEAAKIEVIKENEITLEDLAPDGGWGWMITLAMILVFITTISPSSSFSIIFGDFIEEQAGLANSLFNSVFMITFSIASLLTNTLLSRYSARSMGIMGGLFFAITDIALAFVRNIYDMAFLYFIQGFGLGLLITICNTVFNAYFVKKRTTVMSASQVIIALGGIIFPKLTEKMVTLYGFRGAAAIMGALSLNSIVSMLVMHPVEWHAKKPEEVLAKRVRKRGQFQQLASSNNNRSTIDIIHVSAKPKWSSLGNLKEDNDTKVPLLTEDFKPTTHDINASISIRFERKGQTRSASIRESLTRHMSTSSLVNSANGTLSDIHHERKNNERQVDNKVWEKEEKQEQGVEVKQEEPEKERKYEIREFLRELVDTSLIKDLCFLNLCFGISFVGMSDFAFSSLLPLMMTDVGYSKSDAAYIVTVSGIAELMSKILLALFTLIVNVKAKYLFFGATIFMEFARIGFLLCEHTYIGVLIMTAIIGFARSWLMVTQPLVIIEDIHMEKFASAYGIFAVISGLVTIIFGAIVGFIKDWTNSFKMYQISLLVLNGAFIIPWALQFIFMNLRKKRREQQMRKVGTNTLSSMEIKKCQELYVYT